MKKVVIVFGKDCGDELNCCMILAQSVNPQESCLEIDCRTVYAGEALQKVLKVLREEYKEDYRNTLVIYSGENLHLLDHNLPCLGLDAGVLVVKLKEAILGGQKPRQKIITNALFAGGIKQLISS